MARIATTFIQAVASIAAHSHATEFEVTCIAVDPHAMTFTHSQTDEIAHQVLSNGESASMYMVCAGDKRIGYIYVIDCVYFQCITHTSMHG